MNYFRFFLFFLFFPWYLLSSIDLLNCNFVPWILSFVVLSYKIHFLFFLRYLCRASSHFVSSSLSRNLNQQKGIWKRVCNTKFNLYPWYKKIQRRVDWYNKTVLFAEKEGNGRYRKDTGKREENMWMKTEEEEVNKLQIKRERTEKIRRTKNTNLSDKKEKKSCQEKKVYGRYMEERDRERYMEVCKEDTQRQTKESSLIFFKAFHL